jgi:ADP-heptose:LPS heptosyltransferase
MHDPITAPKPPDVNPNGHILLIRLKSIGDVLFTLPAVHVIRENFPEAKITFLVSKEHAPLLAGYGDVNETLALDRARYRGGNPKSIVQETFGLLRRFRREKFSLAVDFQGYGETALLTWCTRATDRWGNVYQNLRRWAYTRGIPLDRTLHPAAANIALLNQCGLSAGRVRNEFVLPRTALEEARGLWTSLGLSPCKPTLYIQPFTSARRKNWPLGHWLALATYWRDHGVQVLVGGGPAERAALEPARQAGFPVSAGASLLITAGVMKLSSLAVGSDTGMLHLAVAMNQRVVMLMAKPGARTVPFQHEDWALMPSAGQTVSSIKVDAVVEACARAFAEWGIPVPVHSGSQAARA